MEDGLFDGLSIATHTFERLLVASRMHERLWFGELSMPVLHQIPSIADSSVKLGRPLDINNMLTVSHRL